MKKLIPLLVLLTLVISAVEARAGAIKADSAITSVVVYPDRALVTRGVDLELTQGEHTVVFENLPANIDTDSIRAKGGGEAAVRILSIESKKVILEHAREEQVAQLEAEIESVKDQIAAAKSRGANLDNERKLVQSIGVYAGEQFSKEFVTRQPSPQEWDAMVEFHRENLARLSEEIRQTKVMRRELGRRLDALSRERSELRGRSQRAGQEVKVALSAHTPGRFNLQLSCVIYGTSWYPTYDARANVKKEKVEIAYIGNVRQNTGEDWTNVVISLSTARPAIGARMPEIAPWLLRPRPPVRYEAEALEKKAKRARGLDAIFTGAPAEMADAQIVQRGTSVQFKIQRKMDIPSDNAYHRMTILAKQLPAKLSYMSTPRLSPFAYLAATITNTTGAQWLGGRVSVFVDGDFIGTSSIKTVAQNEEIELHLGVDEGIKIEREELVRKEDETRIFGKKKERVFKDKITVENHKSQKIELLLIDSIPVSQHEDIKVSDVKFSEKPSERDPDKEIVKWKVPLAPGEKKEITIEFKVTHPLDMIVGGL
ncbi:MAG: mucoidy inhibitor MuiA family protein [Candidatus Abyssubacteria bacterium]|nr:mucoidy inhibitor MuiA family protein [Candidatus Abyssubacteria bacterium]